MNRFLFLCLLSVVACSGESGGGSSDQFVPPVVDDYPRVEPQFPTEPRDPVQTKPDRTNKPFKLKKTYNGTILTMLYPSEANKAIISFGGEDALRLYKAMDIRVATLETKEQIKQGHDVGCRLVEKNKAECELSLDYKIGLIINDKVPGSGVWKPFKNTDSWTGEVLIINDRRETAVVQIKNKDAEALYETLDIVGKPKDGDIQTHEKLGTHVRCEKTNADLEMSKHDYSCTMTIKYEKGYVTSI